MSTPSRWITLALVAASLSVTACARTADHRTDGGSNVCATCHMVDYRGASGHVGRRPTTCGVCHNDKAWSPSEMHHPWELTGAHARTACAGCHVGDPPVYEGTHTACVDCHRADFDHSTFPGHRDFGTNCVDCHNTDGWRSKTWDPDAPEPSAHEPGDAGAVAADAGVVAPTEVHAAPTRPEPARHGAVHLHPAQVATTPWQTGAVTPAPTPAQTPPAEPTPEPTPATPPPDNAPVHPESAFPIQSGNHAGISCRQCHSEGGAMGRGDTNCVQCHPRSRYDGVHGGVGGYPQGSAAPNFCVNCHRHGTRRRN